MANRSLSSVVWFAGLPGATFGPERPVNGSLGFISDPYMPLTAASPVSGT